MSCTCATGTAPPAIREGAIVFYERIPGPSSYTNHGEIVVTRVTASYIYGLDVSKIGDHNSGEDRALLRSEYTFPSVTYDWTLVRKLARELRTFANGPRGRWVEYVYTKAGEAADKLLTLAQENTEVVGPPTKHYVSPELFETVVSRLEARIDILSRDQRELRANLIAIGDVKLVDIVRHALKA